MTGHQHRLHLHRRNARRLGIAYWVNIYLGLVWGAMLPVTLLTSLKSSVPFVAAISIYALIVGHMASAFAAVAGKSANETAITTNAPDIPPGP